jgi:hypothetical protein
MQILDVLDPCNFQICKSIYINAFGDYTSFEEIIDYSLLGRLVALTMKNSEKETLSLAVIELYHWSFKIGLGFKDQPQHSRFQILQALFCPRDMHMVISYVETIVEERYDKFVIDLPKGQGRQLDFSDNVESRDNTLSAILYITCSYTRHFQSICSSPIKFLTKEARSNDKGAFILNDEAGKFLASYIIVYNFNSTKSSREADI